VVEINGGEIGRKLEAVAAQITVNDGLIDDDFSTYEGTITEVNGGSIVGRLRISGSVLNVRNGSVGTGTNSSIRDSEFNVSGGTVNNFTTRNTTIRVDAGELANWVIQDSVVEFHGGIHGHHKINGSELSIYGGVFTRFFEANSESTVTIYGQGFLLDGQPIPGLDSPGDSVIVPGRGGAVLTGVATNGDPIEFELFEFQACRQCEHHDVFTFDSTVRVVFATPEPSTLLLMMVATVGMLMPRRGK
jgi:hypothetical protein